MKATKRILTVLVVLFWWGTMMMLSAVKESSRGEFSRFYVIPAAVVCGSFAGLGGLWLQQQVEIEKLRKEITLRGADHTSG